MAKLTVNKAAQAVGVWPSTIRRAIYSGRISCGTDGLIDTEALIRAGYTLKPESREPELFSYTEEPSTQATSMRTLPPMDVLHEHAEFFRQLREEFRTERALSARREERLLRRLEQFTRSLIDTLQPEAASARIQPLQYRKAILRVLKQSPTPLSRQDIQTAMGITKSLKDVLQGMYRVGLVTRTKPGVYTVPSACHSTPSSSLEA